MTISEKSIKIEPNSTKKVPVMIKMPEKSFPGMVLGGLRFYQDAPDLKGKSGIVNTFSYSSPVSLTENSEDKPKNELSLISVQPSQRNSHPFIEATLENKAATVIENLVVDGKVYIKGENEPIYVKKEANLEMAPYSYFNLGFDLHDSMLEAGKYHLVLNIKADEEDYVFEDDFEATAKEARDFNENSVYAPEKNTSYLLYIIIGLIFIILLIFVIFIVKNNISK
ncbi:DUF3324 domain-containing protein [Vagococcus jeotgali]|uniref:DUF3324 domain-containing protein n=1 Tax=Vagococcus jeotgali TaxID=3109030 RepID=UPI002DD9E0B1|nr:DUF3324 domain-containing protein [Vagococcus sp. B2T-5]